MDEKEVPVFIEGENICFLPQNSEHINLYVKWENDPKVRKYAREIVPSRVEDLKRWFEPPEGRVSDFIGFEIWHKKDKKSIGRMGLGDIDWINGWAYTFIKIGELDYWGQNIATEATELLIEYAFNELNLNKLCGRVAVDNIGSWTVAEKIGFECEGLEKHWLYIDGKYHDIKSYALLKEDWIKRNK